MPPRDTRRPDRVAEAVREEIATFLAGGVKDPRVTGLVTVTAVEMSRDLAQANVFVSISGDADRAMTMAGLESVANGLRGPVGRALSLRIAPHITFREDESIARATRIESLLAGLKQHDAHAHEIQPQADGSRPPAPNDPKTNR
jgi:ribosome-binding factor A